MWKCKHKKCTKLCWEICNRDRCNEPCTRKICQFGHRCIGLCGEPCPKLCRICDKNKVTELFFGTEDEEGALFIELQDCGHIFEVTAMDYWMQEDGDDIKLKECPRCKTPIRLSYRYANIVKEKLSEVEEVKKRLIKEEEHFQLRRRELEKEARSLETKYPDIRRIKLLHHMPVSQKGPDRSTKRVSSFEVMWQWLQQRKTMAEINTIDNQIRLLKQIYKVRDEVKKDLLRNISHQSLNAIISSQSSFEARFLDAARELDQKLNVLETDLMQFQISSQRLTDIRDEIVCVGLLLWIRVVQCEVQKRSIALDLSKEEWLETHGKLLDEGKRLSQEEADEIEGSINRIRRECGLESLTREERVMIVKAMKFSKGHWFKCPNGHIYAIGECGGAMQERKCPDCEATIGGTDHRLHQGNQVIRL